MKIREVGVKIINRVKDACEKRLLSDPILRYEFSESVKRFLQISEILQQEATCFERTGHNYKVTGCLYDVDSFVYKVSCSLCNKEIELMWDKLNTLEQEQAINLGYREGENKMESKGE